MLPGSVEIRLQKRQLRAAPRLGTSAPTVGIGTFGQTCWPKALDPELIPAGRNSGHQSRTVASAIRPCDQLAGVVLMGSPRNAPRRPYDFGLKVVGALRAIIATSPKAAAFETCVPSRMGTDHCGRAFRSARHC